MIHSIDEYIVSSLYIIGNGVTYFPTHETVRLEHAAYLLEQTNFNITEIALRCGFDSVNYFSRLFKRYYNTSPTEFRAAHIGELSS
jgi:AraC-like DNA-binding protein